jgi:hypothetical protein
MRHIGIHPGKSVFLLGFLERLLFSALRAFLGLAPGILFKSATAALEYCHFMPPLGLSAVFTIGMNLRVTMPL